MNRNAVLICLFLFLVILSSCNMPEKVSDDEMREIVASTIQAKANMIASMTPPTETPTNTSIPTETPTPTITMTPTKAATATWAPHAAGEAEVLILYYYDIASSYAEDPYYQWESLNYIPKTQFEQEVRILYELGYTSVSLSQVINVLRNGGELPERPVMFTFDSTERGQYKNAYPILQKYGFAGNMFVDYNHIDAGQSLQAVQIQEMMKAGWEIGSSGYYGNGMNDMGKEIGQSKGAISEKLGCDVIAYAYPDGYTDPAGEMISRASRYGYMGAFAGNIRSTKLKLDSIYYLPRFLITNETNINQFLEILPWKEGSISRETMEWGLPTPTPDPTQFQMTADAQGTLIALDEAMLGENPESGETSAEAPAGETSAAEGQISSEATGSDPDDDGLMIQRP